MITVRYCTPARNCVDATATERHADTIADAIAFAIGLLAIGGLAYLLTKG